MPGEPELARVSAPSRSRVLSVSALVRDVRDLLEHRYPLLWVAGEMSDFTAARSVHLYFSLKDDAARVRCVMYSSRNQALDWTPREGMKVEVQALVTLYESRGEFQLSVEAMRPAGLGALFEAFLRLRDKLEKEGLFDAASKREPPRFPRAVGVVTSLQAAARLRRADTLPRRRQHRGPPGVQRRGARARHPGVRDSGRHRHRARDRLHHRRLRRRSPRGDADGGGRAGESCARRARRLRGGARDTPRRVPRARARRSRPAAGLPHPAAGPSRGGAARAVRGARASRGAPSPGR